MIIVRPNEDSYRSIKKAIAARRPYPIRNSDLILIQNLEAQHGAEKELPPPPSAVPYSNKIHPQKRGYTSFKATVSTNVNF